MHALGVILVLASIAYGILLCRAAAHTPRCPTCRIPTEPLSACHGDQRTTVIETIYWCPRCTRVASRRYVTPHCD